MLRYKSFATVVQPLSAKIAARVLYGALPNEDRSFFGLEN